MVFEDKPTTAAALFLMLLYLGSVPLAVLFAALSILFALLISLSQTRSGWSKPFFEVFWITALAVGAQAGWNFLDLPPYWVIAALLLTSSGLNKNEPISLVNLYCFGAGSAAVIGLALMGRLWGIYSPVFVYFVIAAVCVLEYKEARTK